MIAIPLILLVLGQSAQLHWVQLFDPGIFGKPTSEPVKLLIDKKLPEEIEPYVIWTDVRCGRYIAASVYYRKPVTIEDVRESLNLIYAADAKQELQSPTFGIWRVESQGFAIQLADEGDEGVVVRFIHFLPSGEMWRGMMQAQGHTKAANALGDVDCVEWERMFAPKDGQDKHQ